MLKIVAKEVLSVGFGEGGFVPYIEPGSLTDVKPEVSDMPTLPVGDLISILSSKVNDETMSAERFREFVRTILSNY